MENLSSWFVETKPTNRHLAWLLLAILRDASVINVNHRKWIYRQAIQYLRVKDYSQRNLDWFDDCMKLIDAYKKSLNK